MNQELYYDLVKYLGDGSIRKEADEWRRRLLEGSRRQFELQMETSLLFRKLRGELLLVIPAHKLSTILKMAHDHELGGHQGATNTLYKIRQGHWWPGMEDDVREYVKRCDTCQKRRVGKDKEYSSSAIIKTQPFHHIGIDVMGPLPITLTGKRYIILAIDFFTKWTEAVAVNEANAQNIAKFIHTDIICRHGVPQEITSDRGTEFLNELTTEMERTYRIKHIKTTAYHPQGNGLTERMNQTVKNVISKICRNYDSWDHYVDSALFAVRTMRQGSTMFSPFELVYGQRPRREFGATTTNLSQATYEDRVWEYVTKDISRLQLIRRKAATFIDKAQTRQRKEQDKTAKAEELKMGDQVLLYRNLVEASWSAKLEPKWEGPYYVQKIKGQSIWLRRNDGTIVPTAIHRNRVKLYHGKKGRP